MEAIGALPRAVCQLLTKRSYPSLRSFPKAARAAYLSGPGVPWLLAGALAHSVLLVLAWPNLLIKVGKSDDRSSH
jgi:hypothetical protein